ncbi:lyase family protein [Bradyrhizobium diazoefficiens]
MATFAFIESNTSGTGELLLRKALGKGFDIAFLTQTPERYPFLADLLVHPVQVDTDSEERVLEVIQGLDDVVAVFSSSDYYVRTAAAIARRCGVFGADPDAIDRCRHKGRQARALTEAGIRTPRTFQFNDREAARAARDELGFPVVVKPVAGSGSIDVRLHHDDDSFLAHVDQLLAAKSNERGQPVEAGGLVQAFVEGAEFSVEAVGFGGHIEILGVTRKYLGDPPTFLELGHDFPAGIPDAVERQLRAHAHQSLVAVELRQGPSHVELRLGEGGPTTIEINPRLAGGMIPVLMQHAFETNILGLLIDIYAGLSPDMPKRCVQAASIGFFVPRAPGVLDRVVQRAGRDPAIVDVLVTKARGDVLVRNGDFRDRIGHVIARGPTPEKSRAAVDGYLSGCDIVFGALGGMLDARAQNTGRLARTLHPEATRIAYPDAPPEARQKTFAMLAAIDEAHLVMLVERGILAASRAGVLLRYIQQLKASGFRQLLGEQEPRGAYMLYENSLINELGIEIGGAAHLGRSRNDIGATLFRLNLREAVVRVEKSLWRLRSTLVQQAQRSTEIAMPVYSQFQVGTPGTLASYLLAVEQALSRDAAALRDILAALEFCPLGACAGGGTSISVDAVMVASLLGFRETCRSALDAVASRDLGLRAVAAVAIAGTTLTRLAQDYQLWTTLEFGFFELPDDLVGGSSNMPQKRNPYLLEIIKGRAIRPSGQWSAMIAGLHKVPFSNSVEVGSEAMAGLHEALHAFDEAATLMSLVVEGARACPEAMLRSGRTGMAAAIGVAEVLVRDTGMAFRAAHQRIGSAITQTLAEGRDPVNALDALLPEAYRTYQLGDWARTFDYGGGPGPNTTARNLELARSELARDSAGLRARVESWRVAADGLHRKVEALLSN